jgi:polyisoprenoid-binding protein YceI
MAFMGRGRHRASGLRTAVVTAIVAALAPVGSAAPSSGITYLVSERDSAVRVHVGKAGLLSFAGHLHEVAAPVTGSITADPADVGASAVELTFPTARFQVVPDHEPTGDAPKVEDVMRGTRVLDVGRFLEVRFRSRGVTGRALADAAGGATWDVRVTGDVTLHGVTREVVVPMTVTLNGDTLRANGRSTIGHDQFGLAPVTAGGGAVRVRNEIEIDFAIVAHRQR